MLLTWRARPRSTLGITLGSLGILSKRAGASGRGFGEGPAGTAGPAQSAHVRPEADAPPEASVEGPPGLAPGSSHPQGQSERSKRGKSGPTGDVSPPSAVQLARGRVLSHGPWFNTLPTFPMFLQTHVLQQPGSLSR